MSRRCHVLYYPLVLPHDPWIEPPGYPTTGDFPGEFRGTDGCENLQGQKDVEEGSDALPPWSNTWTSWSGASLLNSTP
jgi:hypothetical protein